MLSGALGLSAPHNPATRAVPWRGETRPAAYRGLVSRKPDSAPVLVLGAIGAAAAAAFTEWAGRHHVPPPLVAGLAVLITGACGALATERARRFLGWAAVGFLAFWTVAAAPPGAPHAVWAFLLTWHAGVTDFIASV